MVLLLKRTPATVLANYRPITLISYISKVFTKILAQHISQGVLEVDLLGEHLQGFRKSRACQDNLFILNTLLEKNKGKETHLIMQMKC